MRSRLRGELLGEPGLAHPGLAAEHHQRALTGPGSIHEEPELGTLGLATDERGGALQQRRRGRR
jgi:hypothetical protein